MTSSVAICLAINTGLCSGSTKTVRAKRTRSVTAAAAEMVTISSGFGNVIRSPAATTGIGPRIDAARPLQNGVPIQSRHHHRQVHSNLHG